MSGDFIESDKLNQGRSDEAIPPGLSTLAPIDPQILRFTDALAQAWARYPDTQGSIVEMRRIAEQVRAPWCDGGPPMASSRDLQADTAHGAVRMRMHRPNSNSSSQPALIYLHGGGWTMFSLDTHDRIMRELAARAGVVVVGVDYALSPEAKFPFALEQIEGVVHWLKANAGGLAINSERLAIGGDSAGANLAVATSLSLRDGGEPNLLRGMLLFYGCYSEKLSAQARQGFGAPGNLLTGAEMDAFWRNYLRSPADAVNPLATPLTAQLEGLPAAFVAGAQCDVLAEQSIAFAARLIEACVPVESQEYPGATHSFLEAMSIASIADRALSDAANWLANCLGVAGKATT